MEPIHQCTYYTPVSQSVTVHTLRACNLNEKNQPTNQQQHTATSPQPHRTVAIVPTNPTYYQYQSMQAWHSFISYRKNLQQFGRSGCRKRRSTLIVSSSCCCIYSSHLQLARIPLQWPSTPLQIQQMAAAAREIDTH